MFARLSLIAAVVIVFYGQLLFTDRYSFLLNKDDANQYYSWTRFAASSIQHGTLPLWDPYTQGGRSFIGEMQTALFYPLKLPVYLWPLNADGLPSIRMLHVAYVFAHILAAWFMFFLGRELGLRDFASLVAALAFSLAGFMSGPVGWGWPHLTDSGVWLPLIVLFLIRALRTDAHTGASIRNACYAGLALAMVVLAGGLHLAIMDVLVVLSVSAMFFRTPLRALRAVVIVGVVSFGASAIQLLPSMEYSRYVERYINDGLWLPATQKIPYKEILYYYTGESLLAFVYGVPNGLAEYSPYFGILPLLLAMWGAWRGRRERWPRYLAALAVLAFLYGLGPYFPLHRILYMVVPYLWLAKEPARFIYLTHFAMAILAGFGIQALARWESKRWLQAVVVVVMLFDWHHANRSIADRTQPNYLNDELLSTRGLAAFLKSQPGLFRVNVAGPVEPNIGDLFGVQTTSGLGATRSLDFKNVWSIPNAANYMSIRYFACRTPTCPASVTPVYRDAQWSAIENTEFYPRAWIIDHPSYFPANDAPRPPYPGSPESIEIETYESNRIALRVQSSARILVLSENYSPGWIAHVNGIATPIHRLNRTLKTIDLPAGGSRVELRYMPRSFVVGAILSGLTWITVLLTVHPGMRGAIYRTIQSRREKQPHPAA